MSANKNFSANSNLPPALKSFSVNYNSNSHTTNSSITPQDPKFPPPPSPSQFSMPKTPLHIDNMKMFSLKSPSKKLIQITNNLNQLNLVNLNQLDPYMNNNNNNVSKTAFFFCLNFLFVE